jgi:hypothetical protein
MVLEKLLGMEFIIIAKGALYKSLSRELLKPHSLIIVLLLDKNTVQIDIKKSVQKYSEKDAERFSNSDGLLINNFAAPDSLSKKTTTRVLIQVTLHENCVAVTGPSQAISTRALIRSGREYAFHGERDKRRRTRRLPDRCDARKKYRSIRTRAAQPSPN